MTTSKRHPCCILATSCVPWDSRFQFMEEVFRRGVRHQIDGGIRDLYIFGTAGEGYAVTEGQFDEITRAFLDEASKGGANAMVGLISQSLPTIIERIERARDMGARRFQLSLPSWGVLNDAELDSFFSETCGRFPDCSFLHYNLQRAGRLITGAEYGLLAAKHENLVATKNSTADAERLTGLMNGAPQLQHFVTEAGFAKAATMGECGLLISFASTNFAKATEFFLAGRAEDGAGLAAYAAEFPGLVAALKEAVGDSAHMDGAFDKMFCRLRDPDFPLRLLPPYAGVSERAFQSYFERLRFQHPQWLQ